MNDTQTIRTSYGVQYGIIRHAQAKGIDCWVVDMNDHDKVFITNSHNDPISIDGQVFPFIFMSAEPESAFHNSFFIVGASNKKDIAEWEN